MGAICGIFCRDGNKESEEISSLIMDGLSKYRIDTTNTWKNDELFLGCAVQNITPESKLEVLPYFDKELGLVITADAIIDNRKELSSLLKISESKLHEIPDSQLILMAFIKWGEECPKFLIGDYAFVIWNDFKKELFCVRDHTGNRAFHFYCSSNIFAFCTLAKPLSYISEECKTLNDRWIANFLALEGPMHEVDSNETVYKNIKQLLPAHTLKLNRREIIKKQYWFPLNLPKIRLNSDEEYVEAFNKVFFEAVNCRLRSIGPIGIKMSGGLDSGSVACVAARKLAAEGKRLHAFSVIPFSGYKDYLPKNIIANESEYIEAIGELYSNIDITYLSSEGKHSVTNLDEYIDFIEQPYKFIKNLFWINEIEATAAKIGCTVLLDGQNGNYSISFGDMATHLITLYRKRRWISIHRELREFSKFYNCKYFHVTKVFIKIILSNYKNSIYRKMRWRDKTSQSISVVNPELAQKCKVIETFCKECIGPYQKKYYDLDEARKICVDPAGFSQMGGVDTKMSLKYGILNRDPTRDKRVIEFCMSIPEEQFVNKGRERYLIRKSMNGILPNKVRLNYKIRGTQNADWLQRLVPVWEDIKFEIQNIIKDSSLHSYLNINKIKKALNDIENYPKQKDEALVEILIISLIFTRFIKGFKSKKG